MLGLSSTEPLSDLAYVCLAQPVTRPQWTKRPRSHSIRLVRSVLFCNPPQHVEHGAEQFRVVRVTPQ